MPGPDQEELLRGGGGGEALKAEGLNRAAKAARGESMRRGLNPLSIGGSGGLPCPSHLGHVAIWAT